MFEAPNTIYDNFDNENKASLKTFEAELRSRITNALKEAALYGYNIVELPKVTFNNYSGNTFLELGNECIEKIIKELNKSDWIVEKVKASSVACSPFYFMLKIIPEDVL